MSEWNVYTVGNIEFIYNIFNAVAMLFNDGTYASLFKIAALIGVIGVVIAAAITAGKTLSLGQMGIAIVMYFIFFSSGISNCRNKGSRSCKASRYVVYGFETASSYVLDIDAH